MGGILSASSGRGTSRSNGVTPSGSQALYRYPPPNEGAFFSSHYYLGHRRFETGEPEVFLFGDLQDLNYLPPKPIRFPYKQPARSHPLKTLRSFINIQRDSIKLVKSKQIDSSKESYSVQFMFDSDLPCQFTIFTSITDSVALGSLRETREPCGSASAPFQYSAGSEQTFVEEDHVIHPSQLMEEGYDPANGHTTLPLAILMESHSPDGVESQKQAQLSLCTIDTFTEDNYSIKIIKQKLLTDGMELLLQEVYGLENKLRPKEEGDEAAREDDSDSEDEEEDLSTECVICITDVRDTLLLPCRHLCLCNSCAANLRFQSSNCPICRAPFRALLQIKALEPLPPDLCLDDDTITGNPKYAIPGFQNVPLLQALNGYQLKEEGEDDVVVQFSSSPSHEQPTPEPLQSTTTPPTTTTEFCVVPIEDEANHVTSEPAEKDKPVRTKISDRKVLHTVNQECVSLPGTPDVDHTLLTTTIELDGNCDSSFDPEVSGCGSSISSEVSVKSTDVLLHSPKTD